MKISTVKLLGLRFEHDVDLKTPVAVVLLHVLC